MVNIVGNFLCVYIGEILVCVYRGEIFVCEKGFGKPIRKLFSDTTPQNPEKTRKNGNYTTFYYIMLVSIFALNIEIGFAYYRRN